MPYFADHYPATRFPVADATGRGLRDAQRGALFAVNSHFTLRTEPALVTMPTESGKTAVLMLSAFLERAGRVLVVTPSRLVRNQIAEDFSSLATLRRIGAIEPGVPAPGVHEVEGRLTSREAWEYLRAFDVVFATPNSISPALAGVARPPDELFDLLLVDEAHHSPAETWNEVLRGFPGAKRVLVTATPFRRDRREIDGRIVYSYPIRRAFQDGVFGRIEYIPVAEGQESIDVLIARAAEGTLLADRAAGYSHFLMVRTDTKSRAKELREVYERHTGLNLRQVDSGHSLGHIKRTIRKLKDRELDGIICVDMLGEGFDFPNLKVAAIHAPHRSLAVTLQFIGRFARTNAPDIGPAKFLAAPSSIEIEAEKLYREGAIWQEIVINLSKSRIDQEVFVRETFEQFEEPRNVEPETSDLSLHALRPFAHVKIYKVAGTVDISTEIALPPGYCLVFRRDSPPLSSAVFITKEQARPRWTALDQFVRTEYDLFIIHYDAPSRLLFINASTRQDALYEHIAEQFARTKPRILPLNKINNVLAGLEEVESYNIGMRNRVQHANSESYRIITGPSAQKAISRDDGRIYHRGHIFCGARDAGARTTIGYSSASKVWSNQSTLIPQFIAWCDGLAKRIDGAKGVVTGSELDLLTCGQVVERIPDGVVGIQWDHEVYKKVLFLQYALADGSRSEGLLHEYDLRVDRALSTGERLRVVVSGPGLEWHAEFALGSEELFRQLDGQPEVAVQRGARRLALVQYLNYNPPTFFFADFSSLRGDEHFVFGGDGAGPFDPDQIDVVDWDSAGVDITRECGPPLGGRTSIHEYLKVRLAASPAEVVFYDHGSGEVADFVSFERQPDRIVVRFIHCKGSSGPQAGQRLDDVYEVCGQVVKSLGWINKASRLFDQIERRSKKTMTSRFLKGDRALLAEVVADSKATRTSYEMVVVQPGVSRSDLDARLAEVLAASNDYIRRHCEKLRLLASQ